jgi:hypothetical protein
LGPNDQWDARWRHQRIAVLSFTELDPRHYKIMISGNAKFESLICMGHAMQRTLVSESF